MLQRTVIYSSTPTTAPMPFKRLTPADIEAIFLFIAQQYSVRVDVLQTLIGRYTKGGEATSIASVYQSLARWRAKGWVVYEDNFVTLTRQGMKLVGVKYELCQPTAKANHRYVCSQLRLVFEREQTDLLELYTDREMESVKEKDKPFKIPDFRLVFPDITVKVEAEISRKKLLEIDDVIYYYIHDLTCDRVWYYANDETYQYLLDHIGGHPKFNVYHLHTKGVRELSELK